MSNINTITEYPQPTQLRSSQRARLRSLAGDLPTIMQIGKGGITENLVVTVSDALESHELIKLSVLDNCDYTVREAAEELAEATRATVVSVIGKKLILYRRSLNSKKHIEIPN